LLIANNFATQSYIYYKLLYVNVRRYIMTQEIDLKELEKKACQDSLQGRIIEIVIGFFLIAMIVPMTILKSVFIYFILMPLLAPITKRLQRRYIYPRIGYSKLHTDRRRRPLKASSLI